jgi:hypothetical protein
MSVGGRRREAALTDLLGVLHQLTQQFRLQFPSRCLEIETGWPITCEAGKATVVNCAHDGRVRDGD